MEYIETHPDFIQPESRKREMVNNFLKPGLQDLCVSRSSFTWGVPVEFDPGHVIYVWIDALSNYITALGYDPDGSGDLYNKYWPADVHVIGKDILRFHTIYWPIMLMALGQPLPKQVFGHPWLLFGNDKMSKSKGNVMYADDLVRHFGVDGVRHYVLSEMPFAQDGNITYENIVARYNSELANTLGNLVNRSISMANKYFDGKLTKPSALTEIDTAFVNDVLAAVKNTEENMDKFRVADAIEDVFALARRSNKYIDETTPWVLAKDENSKDALNAVMYNLIEAIRFIGILLKPFMPETSEKILQQINASNTTWDSLKEFGTDNEKQVGTPEVIFARLDEKAVLEKIEAENAASAAKKEEPQKDTKPEIGIEDFAKLDLRVAKVISAEKVEKADKLLKLTLDVGGETRQIVSGIAKSYTPETIVGKNVILIANLKPAKIRGIESKGMLLAASDENGIFVCTTDGEPESGSSVG